MGSQKQPKPSFYHYPGDVHSHSPGPQVLAGSGAEAALPGVPLTRVLTIWSLGLVGLLGGGAPSKHRPLPAKQSVVGPTKPPGSGQPPPESLPSCPLVGPSPGQKSIFCQTSSSKLEPAPPSPSRSPTAMDVHPKCSPALTPPPVYTANCSKRPLPRSSAELSFILPRCLHSTASFRHSPLRGHCPC